MEIDYTNSRIDYIVHSTVAAQGRPSRAVFHHYYWVMHWAVMAFLAVYVSFVAGFIFMAAIFIAMFLVYFLRAVPYSRVLKSVVEHSSSFSGAKRIHLRIDDEGLHETIEDQIQSFAPWTAFKRFAIADDHLLIELVGDQWANIPRKTVVQGDAAFDELVATLRSRNVPEEPSA
jgi:hypothetical protein